MRHRQVEARAESLADAPPFTICEVAHNPPWHHCQYGDSFVSESACYVSPASSQANQAGTPCLTTAFCL